jgi:hypothetical protein
MGVLSTEIASLFTAGGQAETKTWCYWFLVGPGVTLLQETGACLTI